MMLRVETSNLINTAISNAQAVKSCEKTVSETEKVSNEISRIATPSAEEIVKSNEIKNVDTPNNVETIEKKVSILQKANEVLSEEMKIISNVKKDLEVITKDESFETKKEEAFVELKELVQEINDKSESTTFEGEKVLDGSIKEIPRIDSTELGITTTDTKYILDNVRVGGESYVPNYSFDISTVGGSSAALSVLESAISKIESIKQTIAMNINELMQYPEILELDRSEFSGAQSKVRSVNTARLLVSELKNNIRYKITEVQTAQKVQKNSEVISLLTNN